MIRAILLSCSVCMVYVQGVCFIYLRVRVIRTCANIVRRVCMDYTPVWSLNQLNVYGCIIHGFKSATSKWKRLREIGPISSQTVYWFGKVQEMRQQKLQSMGRFANNNHSNFGI